MTGIHRLTKSVRRSQAKKSDAPYVISGVLGFILSGENVVEVPGRTGYVYVKLRGSSSEIIQAYNHTVSPVYGLPVLVSRDSEDNKKYVILGRDIGKYQNWGTSAGGGSSVYLPNHGAQHNFNGDDTTWIDNQQFMPFLVYPSGTYGDTSSAFVVVAPYFYLQNTSWYYGGNTGVAISMPFVPTGTASNANIVLVYLNPPTNVFGVTAGNEIPGNFTGSYQIAPYIPAPPTCEDIPLAAVRIHTGTTTIEWEDIYDVRPFFQGTCGGGTGSYGGAGYFTVYDDGGLVSDTVSILKFTTGFKLTLVGTDEIDIECTGGGGTGTVSGVTDLIQIQVFC